MMAGRSLHRRRTHRRRSVCSSRRIGAHILLEDDWTKWRKTKPRRPCGCCGVRESIGAMVGESSLENSCCYVAITSDGKFPEFDCRTFGENAKPYQLSTGLSCSASTPCTNVPINCPGTRCNHKIAIWSYNMAAHWADAHPGETMPQSLKTLTTLRPHEREYLERDRLGRRKTRFPKL